MSKKQGEDQKRNKNKLVRKLSSMHMDYQIAALHPYPVPMRFSSLTVSV